MNKVLIHSCLIVLHFFLVFEAAAQKEILKGLFDKEEPVFNTAVLSTDEEGVVKVVFYFTHSKLAHLEASFWMEDNGKNLSTEGNKKMLRGLNAIGNRQQDTIRVSGLKKGHFYTFGLDYKKPSSFNSKFVTKVLQQGYQYEYAPRQKPREPLAVAEEKQERPNPCVAPSVFVRLEESGYCGPDNRPAIIVECENCWKKDWEFSIETRTEFGNWETTRSDGKRQVAYGNATRKEPLCTLEPGTYQIRVLAWGANCRTPVINTLPQPFVIRDLEYKAAKVYSYNTPKEKAEPVQQPMPSTTVPDTCGVKGWGMLYGDYIQGTIELEANSTCDALEPFAQLTYIHPGHRDVELPPISLSAGRKIPFELALDANDLKRGIHPIRVVTYVRPNPKAKPIPVSSFWIRAKGNGAQTEETFALEERPSLNTDIPVETQALPENEVELPTCSKIGDLQLIYAPNDPTNPRYISWESPDCCLDENCSYFIWAGANPVDIRLLVQGKKMGELIREELVDLNAEDRFFEVVITSKNGTRKASYVVGEGAQYDDNGIESYEQQVSISPSAGKDIISSRGGNNSRFTTTPSRPISDFGPCKIYREVSVIGDKPIHPGDDITIRYDHSGTGYSYTLYHQPMGSSDWLIAPGTLEMQSSPEFFLRTAPEHSGKYIVLVYKLAKNWGCLSGTPDDPTLLQVSK